MTIVSGMWEQASAAPRLERLPMMRRADVASSLSCALDLAEGRPMGHAQRVAYIALAIADLLGVDAQVRRATFYAALLHDIGVASAAAALRPHLRADEMRAFAALPGDEAAAGGGDRNRIVEIERALHEHVEAGAELVRRLGFDSDIARAVRHHHEWWDGNGFPDRLASFDIPVASRLVAVADVAERLVSAEQNPLAARHRVFERVSQFAGRVLDPAIASNFILACQDDRFWIELLNPELPAILGVRAPSDTVRFGERRLLEFAETFSQVVDAKSGFNQGHSSRVGMLAERLARSAGLSERQALHLRIAGVLQDLGHLGVPNRVMAKPEILTVKEMDLMRDHPRHSHAILARLPGMANIAAWVEAHHERMDGRGYPYMLEGAEISSEARILAIAGAYDALTSPRPHRPAMGADEALAVMLSASGTQFDAGFLKTFCLVARAQPHNGRRPRYGAAPAGAVLR